MTERFRKSIETLELPRVLELLAGEAVTTEGKERCLALLPQTALPEVERLQDETAAAFSLTVLHGTPPLGDVRAVGSALSRADRGGALNTRELLDVSGVLRSARGCKEYGGAGGDSVIAHLFTSLTANKYLEEKITASIPDEDTISDAASTELADIRRHKRAAAGKVREVLNKLISSNQAKYLQDAIITQRGGRFVVPVKSEHKNAIPGLVHDVSGSGSTFFIEPMGVVKANNELRELEAKEEKEIERILAALSAECASFQEDISMDYDLLILLDVIFAKAKLASRMNAIAPKLTDRVLSLKKARHPLLDPKKAVANDLSLGGDFDTLVITGPNTGGKTVTLKTIGLLTLMAQCGLHIPAADDSAVAVRGQVLSDIGDEQSIAQNLSTFSSHMVNIVGILEEADEDSLVLFDELGAGTDPVEGAALAAAIIERTRQLGALVAATTHYAELKLYAMTTPGVENASCEFDVDSLAPTYRLLIGVPGRSNAFAISRRLGLSQEVIDRASARVDSENVRFEEVLSRLETQRKALEEEQTQAASLRRELEQSADAARAYRAALEEERQKASAQARAEAQEIVDEARRAADEAFKELNKMRRHAEADTNERRVAVKSKLNAVQGKLARAVPDLPAPPPTRPAEEGDTVELLSMGVQAQVTAVRRDGTLELQAGAMKLSAKQEVRLTAPAAKKKQAAAAVRRTLRMESTARELDLRGMTVDEALACLDMFLDNALMGKLETAVIIHGKGTGAVRAAVRSHLKGSRYVKSFRPGRFGEGEDGVTVVELK